MSARLELEDTFGDVLGKASRGTRTSVERLSERSGVERGRIEQFMADRAQPNVHEAQAIAHVLDLDAAKLADSGLRRWYPSATMPGFVVQQINAPHPSNGYFLILRGQGTAALVDPAGDPGAILATIEREQVEPRYILLTHKHADHADALEAVRMRYPNAAVIAHHADARELGRAAHGALDIHDGDLLPFGDGAIVAIHTPGHTDGSSCFCFDGTIFTGDTLFAGSIGRTNGPSTGYADHRKNIRVKILTLPEETVVLPGHGPPSTVAQEKAHNPFF